MADLLETGAGWLNQQLAAHASRTVIYRRGNDFVSIAATVGATRFEQDVEQDLTLNRRLRDYLIVAADLDFGDGVVEPQRFDEIEESDGKIFRVLPPGGIPAWEWSDHSRTRLRIHTEQKGS